VTTNRYGVIIGFIGLYDTARDYTLHYTLVSSVKVFTRLMVTASNGGRSLSSGFPYYPRVSAIETLDCLAYQFSTTTTILTANRYVTSAQTAQKTPPRTALLFLRDAIIVWTAQETVRPLLFLYWQLSINGGFICIKIRCETIPNRKRQERKKERKIGKKNRVLHAFYQ
jgi:hypothetical protein